MPAGTSGTYGAVPSSGEISLRNFYGTSNTFIPAPFPPGSTSDVDLRSYAISQGWDGNSKVQFTIGAATTLSSTSTSTPALTISGSFPNGVELVINGSITGRGGNTGGTPGPGAGASTPATACGGGRNTGPAIQGGNGGTGLYVNGVLVTITNAGTIAGGGGGGGGGSSNITNDGQRWGGSGGGGGAGGGQGAVGGCGIGFIGNSGANATLTSPGAGGAGNSVFGGGGGSGGTLGQSGQSGFGRVGLTQFYPPSAGGAGGNSVVGDATITWIATGTRLGPIS